MIDTSKLDAAIAALQTQTAATETTEAGATKVILSISGEISAAVQDAIAKDNAADQGTADAVQVAIDAVTARFTKSAADLGSAIATVPTGPATT